VKTKWIRQKLASKHSQKKQPQKSWTTLFATPFIHRSREWAHFIYYPFINRYSTLSGPMLMPFGMLLFGADCSSWTLISRGTSWRPSMGRSFQLMGSGCQPCATFSLWNNHLGANTCYLDTGGFSSFATKLPLNLWWRLVDFEWQALHDNMY